MHHAKLLDVLTSLPVSQSVLPRAVCFATSRPASHAICKFIDSSGYASGPIRRCLFIDYIIILIMALSRDHTGQIKRGVYDFITGAIKWSHEGIMYFLIKY